MRIQRFFMLCMCLALWSLKLSAQQVDATKLPNYIVVTVENTKLLGGIGLTIDWKNSEYKAEMERLYEYLQSSKNGGQGVRTLTDLLNVMSNLGFEYVDSFNASSFGIDPGSEKQRNNVVFKKAKR